MARRRFTRLSPEGLAFLAVLAVVLTAALIRDINLLLAFFSVLAGLALLNWRIAAVTLRGLELKRMAPRRIAAGDALDVDLVATSHQRRGGSWSVRVFDRIERLAPGGAAAGPLLTGALFPRIPPGTSVAASYRGRLLQRGRYRLGPLVARTRFPLGLVECRWEWDQMQELVVLPRLGRLAPDWQRRRQETTVGSRESERRQGTHEGEFHGLRDWRSGDSRRWIHWRTSARQNTLMVRQFERQRHQDLTLLVELWQPPGATARQRHQVELAVSLAATLVYEMGRRGTGQLVLGISAEHRNLVRGAASMALAAAVLESLAVVEPTGEDHLPGLLAEALDNVYGTSELVLVSTRPVDLTDTERFQKVWNDPWKRPWLSSVHCVDLSGQRWRQWFEPAPGEEVEAP